MGVFYWSHMKAIELFNRKIQVRITDSKSITTIENLRIQFEIVKSISKEPNTATVKIYNLTDDIQNQINGGAQDIELIVGYEDNMALLFKGNIKFVYKSTVDAVDKVLEIDAGDGHHDYNSAIVNVSLSKNSNDDDIVNQCTKSLTRSSSGKIAPLQNNKRTRGKVISAPTRCVLDDVARKNNCNWSTQDGKLTIVKNNGVIDNSVFVISTKQLLEQPTEQEKSLRIKTMLNPFYRINSLIKIDNSLILEAHQDINQVQSNKAKQKKEHQAKFKKSHSGQYKVIKHIASGDTHSNEWFSTVEVVSHG